VKKKLEALQLNVCYLDMIGTVRIIALFSIIIYNVSLTLFRRIIISTVMHVYSTLFVNPLRVNKEAAVYTDGCTLTVII
jgi:hypothetical protein